MAILLPTVQAAIVFNSSESIRFNVSFAERARVNGTGLDLNSNNVYNYFGNNCGDNEFVKRIKPDGTYVCGTDDTGTGAQNLSEVLAHGNKANTSLDMSGNHPYSDKRQNRVTAV